MDTRSTVDLESPWLGLRSFSPATKEFFFGRSAESDELVDRIRHKTLTVLFGQSGLGKTSLIGAGVIPRLQAHGYTAVRIQIRFSEKDSSPEQQVLERILPMLPRRVSPPPDSLWLLFHDPIYGLLDPSAPRFVLILDQFEEIFTLGDYPSTRSSSAKFRDLLADLVENRVPSNLRSRIEDHEPLSERIDYSTRLFKVLISLREDYLHALERWRPMLPSLMDNRFELRSLSGQQALAAILGPASLRCSGARAYVEPIVSRSTAVAIVRFVAGTKVDTPVSEIDAVPPLLSLLCQQLNAKRPANENGLPVPGTTFGTEHLSGNATTILADFYRNCFSAIPEEVRDAVKRVIEESLVSRAGIRESLSWDGACTEIFTFCGEGVDASGALRHLIDERLLVVEERRDARVPSQQQRDARKLELTHDILVGPVCASRDERRKREANAAARVARRQQGEPAIEKALRLADAASQSTELQPSDLDSRGAISPSTAVERKYWAYLSYSHLDDREPGRQWACWLQQTIETFKIPTALIGTRSESGWEIPTRLFPVFRDEEELLADADLTASTRLALEQSETLIVICSPRAVKSRFVNEDIRYFKEWCPGRRILPVVIDGEPNALDRNSLGTGVIPDMECLPAALRYGVRDSSGGIDWEARSDFIFVDLRLRGHREQGYTNTRALARALRAKCFSRRDASSISAQYAEVLTNGRYQLIAGIINVSSRNLGEGNEARRSARARRMWWGLVTHLMLLLVFVMQSILVLKQWRESERLRKMAETSSQQAKRQREMTQVSQRLAETHRSAAEESSREARMAKETALKQTELSQVILAAALQIAGEDVRAREVWNMLIRDEPQWSDSNFRQAEGLDPIVQLALDKLTGKPSR